MREVNELLEGQILAQDIEADEGVILLRRGTYLSQDMIARLREIASPATMSASPRCARA